MPAAAEEPNSPASTGFSAIGKPALESFVGAEVPDGHGEWIKAAVVQMIPKAVPP